MTDLEQNLRTDLAIIAVNWKAMLNLPRAPAGDRVDTTLTSPMPIPVGVLNLRFEATHQLAAWAHLVWDEMHLTARLDLMDTVAVCKLLAKHAGFLARHPAGHDACAEIGTIASKITELIEQTRAARYKVGQCPDCEGTLIAYMQVDGAPLPSDLRCNLNPDHVWDQTHWQWLGTRISGQAIRYEDAARRLAAVIGLR